MKHTFTVILGVSLLASWVWAENNLTLNEAKVRDSYSLGYEFGSNIKRQGIEIDVDVLTGVIQSGLEGKEAALSPKEMAETLRELCRKVMVQSNKRYEQFAKDTLGKGKGIPCRKQDKRWCPGIGPRPSV